MQTPAEPIQSRRRRFLALLLTATLPASGAWPITVAFANPRPVAPRGPLPEAEQRVVELFEAAAPSVAYITSEVLQPAGLFGAEVSRSAGSGFVWDDAGHIVTNHHVVDGARRLFVRLEGGARPVEAALVGSSPEYDLAVVRLASVPRGLRPIPLGTSRDLRIGQTVYAIGNPFGLSRTLTQGLVSALDRQLPTTEFREVSGVIQTDAAINPGNSGGPLLDSAGRLVGVNTAIRSASGSSSGVGFAIPVDLVNRVVPALITRGRAPLPGIGIAPVRPDLVARAGISGVVVGSVAAGSPAAQAGLRALDRRTGELGDVIVAVEGRTVPTLSTFVAELDRVGIGNVAEITVLRAGRELRLKVRVIDVVS